MRLSILISGSVKTKCLFSPAGIASQLGTRLVFSKGRMILRCCDLLQQENLSSTQSKMAGMCFLASAMLK